MVVWRFIAWDVCLFRARPVGWGESAIALCSPRGLASYVGRLDQTVPIGTGLYLSDSWQ
jgi:hypothetical protein